MLLRMKVDMKTTPFRGPLSAVLCLVLWCAGCATISVPGATDHFRSERYIIYRLKADDTSASVAERFLSDPALFWMIEDANENRAFQTNHYVVIPLVPPNRGGLFRDGVQQVPILCYHFFGKHCDSPLCVPEEVFTRQMQFLKDNGYRTITPEQLLAFMEYRKPLPKKSVMITVDDGYSSFYTVAYPIMKKHGFTATLFVYTDFVGVSRSALSWGQLRELKAEGFSIGSHSVMHSDLSQRGEDEAEDAYLARLHREIFESKAVIDAKLNQDTFFFAYPFGRFNAATIAMVRQAGYKLAVTVNRGGNPFFTNPYALQRDQILERDMVTFALRLKTFYALSLR